MFSSRQGLGVGDSLKSITSRLLCKLRHRHPVSGRLKRYTVPKSPNICTIQYNSANSANILLYSCVECLKQLKMETLCSYSGNAHYHCIKMYGIEAPVHRNCIKFCLSLHLYYVCMLVTEHLYSFFRKCCKLVCVQMCFLRSLITPYFSFITQFTLGYNFKLYLSIYVFLSTPTCHLFYPFTCSVLSFLSSIHPSFNSSILLHTFVISFTLALSYLSICVSFNPSILLHVISSILLLDLFCPFYLSSIHPSRIHPSIHWSIHPSIHHLSIYLTIHLSIHLSICIILYLCTIIILCSVLTPYSD